MAGLNDSSSIGGKISVSARVASGSDALFEGTIQNESAEVLDTGLLQLQPSSFGQPRLTLLSDSGSTISGPTTTTSATPGTINWIEPLLLLDTEQLQAEIDQHAAGGVTAWSEWQVSPMDAVRLRSRWDTSDVEAPRYRVEAVATRPSVTLTRDLQVASNTAQLVLAANMFSEEETSSITIQVRANGTTVATRQIGASDGQTPWAINLGEYAGENVTVDLEMLSNVEGFSLDWSLLEFVE